MENPSIADPSGAAEGAAGDMGFRIGQRVHFAGDPRRIGTVRYVGKVEGYDGEWVGVDWDDGDGKHDGSLNGVRYFAAGGERSGSFVRPKNLSAGISFLEGLYLRYRSDSTKEEEDEMYVYSTSKRHVAIQLVGKNKVKEKLEHFEELLGASISYLGVSSIEPADDINKIVPNLKELDLTGNLLSRWKDIDTLCEALPALEVINLTNNLMDREVTDLPSLSGIRILVLNNCSVTWDEVETIKEYLPAAEELHLMANKIRVIRSPTCEPATFVQGFHSLRLLNLEDNHIESWDEVLNLSFLNSLEQLHLNRNKLKHIHYPMDHHKPELLGDHKMEHSSLRHFEKLQCLLLGSNEIEDLASVDALNLFPSLVDIRLSENPIVDPAKGGLPRFVLVARLAKVKMLNGSEVSQRERKESEIRYVRLVMGKMQSDDPEAIKQLHPRFEELKALHGISDEKPSSGITGPQKMASGFLCITLKCVGASMGEKQPLTKKLPPTTTVCDHVTPIKPSPLVGKLKLLCDSFFKLKDIKLRLFLQEEGSPLPQLLDDDMAPIMDLGIGTEATILVDEEC